MTIVKHTFQFHMQIGGGLALCLLFAGAYYQWPLYSSNQNAYFILGLARAGYGYLSSDWLAHQTDNVPVFSAMVYLIHSFGSHWMFYALHGAIAAIYAASLFAITTRSSVSTLRLQQTAVFVSLLTFVHTPEILNCFSTCLPGLWRVIAFIQKCADSSTNGLAGQYILSRYLQPSAFGVLFLTSLALFINKREHTAVLCAVVAATIHTSLILHAGILIAAYMIVLLSEKHVWMAAKTGTLALVLILPIVIYIGNHFVFSDTQALHSVSHAISVERQSHHAVFSVWFSKWSCVQLAIVFAGLVLSRKCKRLFIVLLSCIIFAISLTILQVISGNLTLALLFPWRTSAWLIPVCTAIVLGNVSGFVGTIIDKIQSHRIRGLAGNFVVALSISFVGVVCLMGVYLTISRACDDPDYGTVISYARKHAGRDQTYLIPLNLERFRLAAGLPVFVDLKSGPARSAEVVEWHDRVQLARAFYESKNSVDAVLAWADIQEHSRVTHVIVEGKSDHLRGTAQACLKFQDTEHVVYEMRNDEDVEQPNALGAK